MQKPGITPKSICAVLAVAALMMFGTVSAASAHSGEFAKFNYCSSANPEVNKCLTSEITGGITAIGNNPLPLVNPVTLQGGYGFPNEEGFSRFYGATNGVTLSRSPQPIPGGLIGVLSAGRPALINNPLIRRLAKSSINRLFATIELAGPASRIEVSENNLANEVGPFLKLPIKMHLENPLLGSSCYVGSSATPIVFNLTAGTTSPPPPNQPITGTAGQGELLEGAKILRLSGSTFVDNAWSVPRAEHCGGILAPLIDPLISRQLGLPSPAGHNTLIVQSTNYQAGALTVNEY